MENKNKPKVNKYWLHRRGWTERCRKRTKNEESLSGSLFLCVAAPHLSLRWRRRRRRRSFYFERPNEIKFFFIYLQIIETDRRVGWWVKIEEGIKSSLNMKTKKNMKKEFVVYTLVLLLLLLSVYKIIVVIVIVVGWGTKGGGPEDK